MKRVSLYMVMILLLFTGVNCPGQAEATDLMVHVIDVGHGDCIFI